MRNKGEQTEVGKIVSEEKTYDNPYFPVVSRVVKTPQGEIREPQLVWDREGKEFSVALALTTDNKFVLIREPKYGQMRRLLSVPTGGIKKGEAPLDTAKREFKEETGYEAEDWTQLRQTPIVDFADKIAGGEHHFFFGKNAHQTATPENLREVVLISPEQASQMIDGEIEGERIEIAMSLVGIMLGLRYLEKANE